jgi:hypothetical protein
LRNQSRRTKRTIGTCQHAWAIERGRIVTIRTQVGNMCGFLVVEHLIDEALPELR